MKVQMNSTGLMDLKDVKPGQCFTSTHKSLVRGTIYIKAQFFDVPEEFSQSSLCVRLATGVAHILDGYTPVRLVEQTHDAEFKQ